VATQRFVNALIARQQGPNPGFDHVKLLRSLDDLPECFRHGALAIGNFDGVHRGHGQIIRQLIALADRVGGPSVVFTFDPHPARLLHPEQPPMPLCSTERKVELLAALGVDAVLAYPTNREFLERNARDFFDHVVISRLDAKAMVEGTNFFFGHDRSGNVDVLRTFCGEAGLLLEIVEPIVLDDEPVSSTRIRRLIASGKLDEANLLLTAPYRVWGTVVRGAQRGATLGFPTANLGQPETLLPGEGIYAGCAWVDKQAWPAAISLGPNPTFAEARLKIEIHLVGFEGDLYGKVIEVDFLSRLRDIRQFDSAEMLVSQLHRDVVRVKSVFDSRYERLHTA